jgi:hypothetical protein
VKHQSLAQRIFRISTFTLLVLTMTLRVAPRVDAAGIRGRLERIAPNGSRYPAQGIAVTVYNQELGRTSPSYTDNNGMYYLNNIPPGGYFLEVWISTPALVYSIQVGEPGTDIPPIVVP